MTNGYLSRDRAHLAKQQRQRRARMVRIDYMPSPQALAAIQTKRAQHYPLCTNSGMIDAIVLEWAELTGINYSEIAKSQTSTSATEYSDQNARARTTPACDPLIRPASVPTSRACAPTRMTPGQQSSPGNERVICGAKRRRDGQPCQAPSVPGGRRCKWHGGCSTGPRTDQGRQKALKNLRQFSVNSDGHASGQK